MKKSMLLSEQLKEALLFHMHETGDSLYAVAQQTQIPYPMLHRWLSGTRPTIRLSTADQIAAWLDVQLQPRPAT